MIKTDEQLDPHEKISKARAQLGREHSFVGAHCLAMNSIEVGPESPIKTMATDYYNLFWSPDFVKSLTIPEIKFVMVHEALHRIFLHPFRLGGRIHKIANIAMDYSINPWVQEIGLPPPKDVLLDKKYEGKTWEQIYQMIIDKMDKGGKGKEPNGQSWGDVVAPTGENGKQLSDSEMRAKEVDASSTNQSMAQAAKMAGQLDGKFAELIDKMYEPEIDYEEIIYKVFTGGSPSGYSMRRPNKSALHNFGIFASGRNKRGSGVVGIGFDTSGSITSVEAANVLGIINGVMLSTKPERVVVIHFDHHVAHVEEHDGNDEIPSIEIHGRGGTDFSPQFDHIEKNGIHIDQYLVVTDGHGPFPSKPPSFPVTWLMTTDVVAPWGTTVRFRVKGQ